MKAKEEYAVRMEMADMHEEFIDRMSTAYDNHFYVETVWYCYAIIEQRISRLISKYIEECNVPIRTDNRTAAISTRLRCLKEMCRANYGSFSIFDESILEKIGSWCEERNKLVHGLVSLKHYKNYDEEFGKLAEEGVPLVFELYDACTELRNYWYENNNTIIGQDFPMKNCDCKKKQCINPKYI